MIRLLLYSRIVKTGTEFELFALKTDKNSAEKTILNIYYRIYIFLNYLLIFFSVLNANAKSRKGFKLYDFKL
jgi:hypothetical protein